MDMRITSLTGSLMAGVLAVASFAWSPAVSADEMHVAFGDIATVESLNFLIALERAKERGVDVEGDVLQVGGRRGPGGGRAAKPISASARPMP